MSWNYRVFAHQYNDEVYFKVHECYYDTRGNPSSYTTNPITIEADNLEDIELEIARLQSAIHRPVLWYGDKFPEEYIVQN
jgi:hypothetical protein